MPNRSSRAVMPPTRARRICQMTDNRREFDCNSFMLSHVLLPKKASCAIAGLSDRTWSRLEAAGKVPAPIRVGKAKRWRAQELKDWIEAGCPDRASWEAIRRRHREKSSI